MIFEVTCAFIFSAIKNNSQVDPYNVPDILLSTSICIPSLILSLQQLYGMAVVSMIPHLQCGSPKVLKMEAFIL